MIEGAAIVLQARMKSQRFPGKALALIAGRSLLAHCVERLQTKSDMRVVLATTTGAEDDPLEREGHRLGVTVIRGPDQDVLGRFVMVASALSLTDLVRATGDNPAVDMDAPRRVLALRRRARVDHVVEYGLPCGTAVEAISVAALRSAAALTADAYDHEHVTPFIRRDPRFVVLPAIAPAAVRGPGLHLSVDTAEDLEFLQNVFAITAYAARGPIPLAVLIAAADRITRGPARGSGSGARDAG
jgi:spore coat polysaccharide biosynthesis protein SpsF